MEKYTEAESRAAELEEKVMRRTEERAPPRPNRPAQAETSQSKLFLFQFLDLVDRYWNGSKSLHKNVKFKGKFFLRGQGESSLRVSCCFFCMGRGSSLRVSFCCGCRGRQV